MRLNLFIFKNAVALHGIRSLKVHAREIIASSGSQLDVTPPTWNQEFSRRTAGSNGDNGKDGKNGPRGNHKVIKLT